MPGRAGLLLKTLKGFRQLTQDTMGFATCLLVTILPQINSLVLFAAEREAKNSLAF